MKTNTARRTDGVAIKALIRSAKDVPCTDCGGRFPYFVMDFDHCKVGTKLFNVSQAAEQGRSLQDAIDEIAKCEVVCANCHRIRTYTGSDARIRLAPDYIASLKAARKTLTR